MSRSFYQRFFVSGKLLVENNTAAFLKKRPLDESISKFLNWMNTPHKPGFGFGLAKEIEQITYTNSKLSDHCLFIVGGTTLVFNMMMQNRVKEIKGERIYNNGFKNVETDADYQERIIRLAQCIIDSIKTHPEINNIALQEAPLKAQDMEILADFFEKFLPEWAFAHYDDTPFCVVSIIRAAPGQQQFFTDNLVDYGEFFDRCQTFSRGDKYRWSNIHAVHGSRKEKSLRDIFGVMIDDMLAGRTTRHDVFGDFNADHVEINNILQAVWAEKTAELRKNSAPKKYHLDATFIPSVDGHQKADGTQVSADGGLMLTIQEARDYEFHYHTGKAGLFSFLFGSGVVLASFILDKVANTALAQELPMVFGAVI